MGIAHEDTLEGLKSYVDKMLLTENHDPDKFMKKKKALPVARITEETYETFFDKDIVFINYFAPWYVLNISYQHQQPLKHAIFYVNRYIITYKTITRSR